MSNGLDPDQDRHSVDPDGFKDFQQTKTTKLKFAASKERVFKKVSLNPLHAG